MRRPSGGPGEARDPVTAAAGASVPQVVISNPILNSPFREPARHFRFSDEGITNEIAEGRRASSYFIPIAKPRGKSGQLHFESDGTQDRVEKNLTCVQGDPKHG